MTQVAVRAAGSVKSTWLFLKSVVRPVGLSGYVHTVTTVVYQNRYLFLRSFRFGQGGQLKGQIPMNNLEKIKILR